MLRPSALRRLLAAALFASSLSCSAQAIKPGLWEITQRPQKDAHVNAQMAEMQKQMASLSPEQRQMMTKMMAKNGVNINIGSGEITLKVCTSKEQAERNSWPSAADDKCQHQSTRSGKQIKSQFTCPESGTQGEGVATLKSGEAFSSEMSVQTLRNGKAELTKMSGEGRWLSGDCGAVAPGKPPGKP